MKCYSKNPLAKLKRYTQYLAQDGVSLIGMYDTKKSTAIWLSANKVYSELDSVKIQQDSKIWNYKILKMN